MVRHLRNVDVLTSAEETSIKEAGQLHDQINMLVTTTTGKESPSSDALRAFIESSNSEVAQLILSYGKRDVHSESINSLNVIITEKIFDQSL